MADFLIQYFLQSQCHHLRTNQLGRVPKLQCNHPQFANRDRRRESNPIRFAVRFSGNFDRDAMTALSGDDTRTENLIAKGQAFICPVQTDKTASCGTCGLCWSATKPVVFLTH